MMRAYFCFVTSVLLVGHVLAQNVPSSSTFEDRQRAYALRKDLLERSPLQQLSWTNIGPTVFSGRVVDVAVDPDDASHFYVAYASGGLWETTNNGASFVPLMDHEMVMTIGDIAVDWVRNKIYVGTGEVNSSRSSYSGVGLYVSSDHGQSWEHLGLGESHHIGRILIDPMDANHIQVAVLGHLYSNNKERGVFSSKDGGASWQHSLHINDSTGVVDLVRDPSQPHILYAAAWERDRKAWNFKESGPSGGVFKSIDNGASWSRLDKASGLPSGKGLGRIGLDISTHKDTSHLYVLIDNYDRRPREESQDTALVKEDFRSMTKEDFLKLSENKLETYLRDNYFPEKYTAQTVLADIQNNQYSPLALAEYLEDANRLLFDTPVIGPELFVSTDGGKTFVKTHEDYIDGLYNSYGYYFGQVRVSPSDPQEIYIMGVPILRSMDGGQSWDNINGDNVHVDHHALWLNPDRPGHLILGNDGGINISYDRGDHWIKCNSPSVGQFYTVAVDDATPYNVYGGLQDNGVWRGSSDNQPSTAWHSSGDYPFEWIMGGDGMMIQIDPRDPSRVYTGYQYGNYFRLEGEERSYITPKHDLGERPYRWNWLSPILLSSHNPDIFYMGSNFLHRSMDRGETFVKISEDLTHGGRLGDVPYGTLTTIDESPMRFGLIYTGSDDGLIHRTRDGGATWDRLSDDLPQNLWVSRIIASHHDENRIYTTLNGYRWDHFEPYVFVSEDQGNTWRSISSGLPAEPVNVILEDPHDADILYVGTDHGIYVTIDGGDSWLSMHGDLPHVPIHDLAIQSEVRELVLGTHGRSFYKVDLTPVYTLRDLDESPLIIHHDTTVYHSDNWGTRTAVYSEYIEPKLPISIYSSSSGQGTIEISTTLDDQKLVVYRTDLAISRGYNSFDYDMTINPDRTERFRRILESLYRDDTEPSENGKSYLPIGSYKVKIEVNDQRERTKLQVVKR